MWHSTHTSVLADPEEICSVPLPSRLVQRGAFRSQARRPAHSAEEEEEEEEAITSIPAI